MTMHDRCVAYARSPWGQKYPDSIPYVSPTGRWIYGTMVVGGLFKNLTRYPGAYPRTLVERIRAMFPDVPACRLLHLFSGSLPKGRWTRVDISKTGRAGTQGFVKPDIVGSVYDLPQLLEAHSRRGPFDLAMADPSYTGQGRKLYGTAEIDTARAFRAMAAALRPGTHVAWLSTSLPLYRKDQWQRYGAINISEDISADQWHHYGELSIERSTGQAYRKVQLFERRAA